MYKKIKVYLQCLLKFQGSPYHNSLINYAPKTVNYVNYSKKKQELIYSQNKLEFIRKSKNVLKKIINLLKIPNISLTNKQDFDLIHCAHCLSLNKSPWVVDTENYGTLSVSSKISNSKIGKKIIKKFLSKKECKKILPWTNEAKISISKELNEEVIEKKMEVLYPAIFTPKFNKIKHNKIKILFIARRFEEKGGVLVLEIFDILTKKYHNIETLCIGPVPKKYLKKYKKNKRINIIDLISQKELFEKIYPSSDIFFYPGFRDTFGFAILEAMSFKIPVVTVDGFARKEIIKDGKTGFIIGRPKNLTDTNCFQKELINELLEKLSLLIENKKLRDKMGTAARKEISHGKFSLKKRNKKLEKIYKNAIRN